MALIKYSAFVTELKGSVGGTTFKGTRSGAVVQNKVCHAPFQPKGMGNGLSAGSAASNIAMATCVGIWKGLNLSERAAWTSAAPSFPSTNKFGESYTPSGYQLFLECNLTNLSFGFATTTTPPTPTSLPSPPTLSLNWTGTALTYTIDWSGVFTGLLFATVPISGGAQPNIRNFRKIVSTTSGGGGVDFTHEYKAVFGSQPLTDDSVANIYGYFAIAGDSSVTRVKTAVVNVS